MALNDPDDRYGGLARTDSDPKDGYSGWLGGNSDRDRSYYPLTRECEGGITIIRIVIVGRYGRIAIIRILIRVTVKQIAIIVDPTALAAP